MRNDQGRSHWYGPNGEQQLFEDGAEVPSGWKDHPFAEPPEEPETPDPFDHDGDGKPGGSLPRKRRRRKAK